jgi:hypothetical protein
MPLQSLTCIVAETSPNPERPEAEVLGGVFLPYSGVMNPYQPSWPTPAEYVAAESGPH